MASTLPRYVVVSLTARNRDDRRHGRAPCDSSRLSPAEAGLAAAAERRRNREACASGYGYCDRARLTPGERAALLPEDGR